MAHPLVVKALRKGQEGRALEGEILIAVQASRIALAFLRRASRPSFTGYQDKFE